MKILLSWLKDYIEITKSPEELSDDLSLFGHQVESMQKIDNDYILDLEITPNRGDCLSILGVAREVAALYDTNIKTDKLEINIAEETIDKKINVKISDSKICPRYTARVIDNIKITDSPDWMQERLKSCGFRPINNIVDATNYVMIETGQPLHAFDYDKIKNGLMQIRLSKKDEIVTTLDGNERILPDDTIVIEDENGIYDLAGIMGGKKSEVDENTKTIILQGAIFDPILIRRASKYLKHQTDASYRYERGVDYSGTTLGVNLAAKLIMDTCDKAKTGPIIDIKSQEFNNTEITFSDQKINHLLGTELSKEEIVSDLSRLDFDIDGEKAIVPSYRFHDVTIWQDLAEEVARIYGYNNIEPIASKSEDSKLNEDWAKRESIKDDLRDLGFTETYSYSFADKDKILLSSDKIEECVEIINPISPATQYLRPSLVTSLLSVIAKNPWAPEVNVFEIGKVFSETSEKWQLGIATTGKSDISIKKAQENLGLNIEIQNIDQNVLDKYKIRRPIKLVSINLDDINEKPGEIDYKIVNTRYRSISKFAPTIRDISIVVDTEIVSEEMEKTIREASSTVLLTEKFDEFTSDKLGENKKSLAFHIWLQNEKGVVSETEASNIINKIINELSTIYKAKLRD